MRFKRTFTDPVPEERRKAYEQAGITAIHGQAQFEDKTTVRVNGKTLRAKDIVVASGAKELRVADGDDLLLTSEQFLDVDELPSSVLFVGGGYIAFEFAHVAARAGSRVTILNDNDEPLHGFDRDVLEKLLAATRDIGIAVELNARVKSVRREDSEIVVSAKRDDKDLTFRARGGVLAAGRVPDIDDLCLERGGIERTKKGVKVDAEMRSVSNPNVFACGDAADAGGLPLTPVAGYTAEIVASNLLDRAKRTVDFTGLASMVYTIPPLGSVGLDEKGANERGLAFDVHQGDMSQWYATRHIAGRVAFYKVLTGKNSGELLGATILGPHAEEQINVLALAVRQKINAAAVKDALYAYPTGSSDLESMLA